jgi:hypothetical protein
MWRPFATNLSWLAGRPVRRCEIESQSTFELIAELSISLAGFGGVAAAFGGSNRVYAPAEASRLKALFSHAFLAFTASLLAISLGSFGFDARSCYLWANVFALIGQIPATGFFVVSAYRFAADPDAMTTWPVFFLIAGMTIPAALLLAGGVILGGSLGFLVSGLSVQLTFGLWAFTRVLTHRN